MSDVPPSEDDTADRSVAPVRDVLRALREETPSDDSRRATLAALGLSDSPAGSVRMEDSESRFDAFSSVQSIRRPGPNDARRSTVVVWVLFGLALGLVLALLLRVFGS